jgi:hypothetical protein
MTSASSEQEQEPEPEQTCSLSTHWRSQTRKGTWEHLKVAWFIAAQNISLASLMYYLQNYRQDLPINQQKGLIFGGILLSCRELLAFLYTQNTKIVQNKEIAEATFGYPLAYLLPAYLAIAIPLNPKRSKIFYALATLILCTGHIFNSVSELQRKFWLAKHQNKGRLYTRGMFSITRHPIVYYVMYG